MVAAIYIVLTFIASLLAGRGRPLGLPGQGQGVLMLERLASEIPRFFNYYTILFLLQAMGTTLLMTLIGCVLGFVLGFGIVLLRQTPGHALGAAARCSRSPMSSSSAASRSW